ncbi:MAG: PQQ-dependent sugar dehydrogenase [Armatimonadota bacterium]
MNASRYIAAISLIIAGLFVLSGCRNGAQPAAAEATGNSVVAERVVGGLQEPVSLVFLSRTQWLVAERRSGRIRWIENGRLRDEPFATVQVPSPSGYHEYGLLGLAVDPEYATNRYVYAFHTVGTGDRATGQRIVRFTVQDGRGTNMTTIVDGLPAGTSCCHNGGRIVFGTDGKLYATLGDTQRQDQAQNYESPAGKVLRYNPDGSIPADNPFEKPQTGSSRDPVDGTGEPLGGQKTPVFALGFRNPFGLTVEPESGEMYLTDNGPDRGDEVNHVVAGDNYGWPQVMGSSDDPHFHAPLWSSGNTVVAPTGIAVYTGTEFSQFRGNLFFAAYIDGRLRRMVLEGPNRMSSIQVVEAAGRNAKLDVAMGPDGRLYYTSLDAIYRLRPGE